MARTVNAAEYALKRDQILDAAQRLIYTKGYEQMAIQDILDELRMSKGAFYHYFGSKAALLEALVARTQQTAFQLLAPIVEDRQLPALAKLQRYFDTAVQWKATQKPFMIELVRVWYNDHNALVRQKIWSTMSKQALEPLTAIIEQGLREGVFNIPFPDHVGGFILALMQGFGDTFADLLLSAAPRGDELQRAERLVAAYNDALERVLGAPAGSLRLIGTEALKEWFGDVGTLER